MDQNNYRNPAQTNDLGMSPSWIKYGAIGTAPVGLYIHRLLPMAILYFFFNSTGLPLGLFYTAMLSPFFYLWLYLEGKRWLTLKFVVCLLPFVAMQVHNGLDSSLYYVRSILLLWTVYVTVYAFCWGLLKCKNLERLFEQLIILNFCAAMLALTFLFTPLKGVLWSLDFRDLGGGGGWAPRLMLLTSEPSVYGQLMAPLLIFTVLRLLRSPGRRNFLYAALITIPLLLSQSFGALSICTATLGVVLFPRFRRLLRRPSSLLILGLGVLLVASILFVPNPIARRTAQIVNGTDSSIHSRTTNAYILAYAIAESKSLWWGAGPGQAKLYGKHRLLLSLGFPTSVLPDSNADTFADMGIIGLLVKFILEIYLFFRTRVYTNTFRLAMFMVPFIYQFTGGYLTNVQEYLMWCFSFAPFFPWLNLQSRVPAPVRLAVD